MMTRISQALKKLKEIFNRPEKSPQIIWPSNRHIILFHTNDKINKFKDLLDIISRRLTINITNDCANSPLYFHLQGIRNSGDIRWGSFQCGSILNVYWNIWDLSLNFLSIFWDGPKSHGSPNVNSGPLRVFITHEQSPIEFFKGESK